MTYEEAYRTKCNTMEELEKMVQKDISTAIFLGGDRVPFIKEAAEKIANEKFGKEINKEENECKK